MFKSRPAKLVLATQLALGLIVTAQAEEAAALRDNNIEHIVVTASGFEQKLVEAPASISVITAEELRSRPYTTLLDAVRDLEGVDIGETRDKTGQGTISMRGMGSDYTLILVDGKRQNNHGDIYPNNFGGNQFGHMPPLDTIERIEVVRGPASTLYGADALGGVINIITKKVTNEWAGSVSHSRTAQTDDRFGEEITTDFNVMGPLIPNVLGMSVRGSAYDRMASTPTFAPVVYPNGQVLNRSLGFGSGGKTVDNKSSVLGGRLSWTPVNNQAIWFDIETSTQEYDNSPIINDDGSREYPVGTVDNINSIWAAGNFCKGATGNNANVCRTNGGTWSRRANPQVGYSPTQEFTRDTWSLSHEGKWDLGNSFMSLSYVDTQNHGRTLPFTLAERAQLLTMIDGTGAYAGMSADQRKALAEDTFLPRAKRKMASNQYTFDAKMDMPFELAGQHTAVVGTQVIRGELEDGVFGMESGTPGEVQEHNMWSIFAEDTWDATQEFALTAGLRRDDHEVFGSEMSPRLYGVYTLSPEWTIKGGVSTGYKTPKTTQLYDGVVGFGGQGTSPMFGNPDLKPETSTSTELALYWEHPGNHNFNITIFNNEFEDKIASQPCGTGTALVCTNTGEYAELGYATSSKTVNIDKVTIQGAELAGRWQIIDTIAFRANYTYTDSEQKSGANAGQPLTNTAKHMANLTLDWAATDDLKLFLTSEIRTKRYRTWDTIKDEALYFKAYEVLHLGASYEASDTVTFTARINNLTDKDFTTYDLNFVECDSGTNCVFDTNGANGYIGSYTDHYNNKDKARNLWVSVNVRF
ncbi:TonB-dependent receptor [Rheinheimera sediminis]|uniref:TonB-dependent receptor domain-containing protein n=1 Tax=Rheinheimera sp. YQF-1 TaxID=2499626 RepID=UPI000FDCA74D|nr:TonB-dependent receptor [Rheinheimera sp. YQF-1]RVT47536.1 TonB-dependent receptor [Rheinheimera sp. YQF-1]